MTFHELIQASIKTLSKQHPDTAQFEVNHLIKYCFKLSQAHLLLQLNEVINDKLGLEQFEMAIKDRLAGKPVDLIIGSSEFCGNTYFVEKGVLIPRSETELLVQVAKTEIKKYFANNSFTCLELGFGSGVISIELSLAYPTVNFFAWDISESAFKLAKKNAKCHNVSNIKFKQEDFFNSNWKENISLDSPFLFVSNPPYIATKELSILDKSVKNYDPITALDGGLDGLDYYRKCITILANYKCIMIFEIGYNQSEDLIEFLQAFKQYKYFFKVDVSNVKRILVISSCD